MEQAEEEEEARRRLRAGAPERPAPLRSGPGPVGPVAGGGPQHAPAPGGGMGSRTGPGTGRFEDPEHEARRTAEKARDWKLLRRRREKAADPLRHSGVAETLARA